MFELNDNLKIKRELFRGTIIYTIDDFYKNPQKVENYLFSEPDKIPLHKITRKPSFNNIYFEDRRHGLIDNLDLKKVYDFLSDLCGQGYKNPNIVTNCTRFKRHPFNNYENCYWWPHTDCGYNGIVYFNNDNEHGTSFYDELVRNPNVNEHEEPWIPKKNYISIKTLEPKYNRFVFFDGYKILHGMNICSDRYFGEEYRKNQVFFFDSVEFLILRELEEDTDTDTDED